MAKRQTKQTRVLKERAAEAKHLLQLELLEVGLARSVERGIAQLLEDDYSEKDWTVIYDATKGGRSELIEREVIDEMRSKARFMYWQGNEFIRRAVRNSMNYIVGKGMTFTLVRGDLAETVADQVNDWWKLWSKYNKWACKQREIVERGCLDGEIFLRWAERKEILCVRFLEPEDINDPEATTKWPLGIKYDPDDVEDVEAYAWSPGNEEAGSVATVVKDWLTPKDVQHLIWFGTKSMVRGIPPYIPILHRVKQYDGWLTDRLVLNKIRSRIALIRKHLGAAPSQIKAFADATKDGDTKRSAKTGDRMDRRRMFKAGTVLDTTGQTEYEFLSPNVQASDVRYDGRNVLLAIATGTGQSEVMATSDASNANFASTWIAEAPPVKEYDGQQGFLVEEFEVVWHRVMIWGQEHGKIPASPDRDDELGYSGYPVEIEPPMLVTRNRKEDTESNSKMFAAAALSRKTWMMRDGLDPEQEQANIEEEETNEAGLPGHDDDDDDKGGKEGEAGRSPTATPSDEGDEE